MLKDINPPKVEDIAVAVIQETNELNETDWYVYLLNMKDVPIEGVLISSRGYGEQEGKKVKTSMLRHYVKQLPPRSFAKVELIKKKLFGLSNEYWVSFFLDGKLYDKKYVFVAESIVEENFTDIPLIKTKGVMIQ